MFIFVVGIFAVLAFRVQQNTTDISNNISKTHSQNCYSQATFIETFNSFIRRMIAVEQSTPPSKLQRERIAAYKTAIMSAPKCTNVK